MNAISPLVSRLLLLLGLAATAHALIAPSPSMLVTSDLAGAPAGTPAVGVYDAVEPAIGVAHAIAPAIDVYDGVAPAVGESAPGASVVPVGLAQSPREPEGEARPVPAPSSLALFGLGLIGIGAGYAVRSRQRNRYLANHPSGS